MKYEYFISLEDERALSFNNAYATEGLPTDPRMTEAAKIKAMNNYFNID